MRPTKTQKLAAVRGYEAMNRNEITKSWMGTFIVLLFDISLPPADGTVFDPVPASIHIHMNYLLIHYI